MGLEDGDQLMTARRTDGRREVMIATKLGMAIRFSEEEVRPMGRDTQGMTAIKLKGDDEVVGMEVVKHLSEQLLVVTEQGFGKRTDIADFPIKHVP